MNKKQALQQCALNIFSEKGYLNTPIRDIIDASGFGTSTFYRNFKNKEDVLKSLLETLFQEIFSSIKVYYDNEADLYIRFIETKRLILDVFIKNKKLAEIYSRSAGISPEIDACIKAFDDQFLMLSQKNIEYGINKGLFKTIDSYAIACSILSIIKYMVYRWTVLDDVTEKSMVETVLSFHESLAKGITT